MFFNWSSALFWSCHDTILSTPSCAVVFFLCGAFLAMPSGRDAAEWKWSHMQNLPDFATEGLGSRIPQQDCRRIEKSRMEFSYSAGVSCSKNVASLFLRKITLKYSFIYPNGNTSLRKLTKRISKKYLPFVLRRLGYVKGVIFL